MPKRFAASILAAHICFYGLYASLNADYLLDTVADSVIGGEFEQSLVALIKEIDEGRSEASSRSARKSCPCLRGWIFRFQSAARFLRSNVTPSLSATASSSLRATSKQVADAFIIARIARFHPFTTGDFSSCLEQVVLEDIRQLVAAGARHVTFGDPDFLNGPTHSLRIARAMHEEFPELTFDFTAKVEHIIKYRSLIPEFARAGCIFVVSAVESLSDTVLAHLEKGHTRRDVGRAFHILRDAGIALRPSFVSFTPWTTIDDFIEVLDFVRSHNLVDHVDPVQYSIRLLVPPGSLLVSRPGTEAWLGPLAQESFSYNWSHTDPRMDELHKQVVQIVEQAARRNEDPAALRFNESAMRLSRARGDEEMIRYAPEIAPMRLRPPRLTEAWFC